MAEGEYTFQTSANFFLCVLQNPLNGLSTSTKRVRRTKHKGAFSGADALQCLEDLGLTRSSARQIANHLLEAGHIQRISGRESIRFEDDPNTWYIFTYYPTHPNTYLTKSLHKAAACMLAVATKSDVLDGHQLPSPSGGSPSSSFAPSLSSSASSSSLLMRESQMASDMIAGRHSQLKPEEILAEDGDNIIFDLDPHSGLPSVKAASVEKLVKYLTNPKLGCVKFRNAFLLTYSSFMAADELLRSLGDRFLIAPTPADAQDMERWEVDFRKPIQLRVFGVLRTWIQRHETDFIDNPELVTKIKNLANTVIAPVSPFWKQNADGLIKHLDRIHTRSEQAAQGLQKTVPILPEGRLTPGEFTFEDLHVLEFARQLTLLEARLYRRIRAVELLENAWNTPSKKTRAPHVIELIDNFNCVSRWTTGEIVSRATLAARVSTISWFIQLAIRLKELNNFNGVMEILSGLNSSAVRRLKKTWAEIPPPLLAVFHEIETVMSHNGNFKDYRECLHSAKPPCLPYLGVYLTDLTFISEGNPDTERGLVNFRKRLRIAQVIEEIQQYQKEEYPITEVPTIMQYISKLDGCPEQKAYEFSITVEGTNTEEAIAKLLLNEKILNEKIQLLENRIVALEEENAALRKESKVAQKFKSRAARDSKAISFMASSLAEIQQSKSENSSSSSSSTTTTTTSPSSSTTSRSSSFSSTSSSNSESQSNSSGDAVPRRTIRRPTLLAQVLPIATPVIKSPPVPESITLQRTEVRYLASTLPPPERISFASVVKSQLSESAGENKSTNSSPTATTDGPKTQRQSAEVRPPVTEASTSAQSSAILSSSDNGSSSTLLASSSSEGEQATTPKLSPSTSTESLPESGGPPKLPERRPPAMTVSVAPRMLPTGRPPARTSTMSVPANPEEVDEGEELKKIASVASHTFGAATAAIQARRSFRGPRRRGGPGGPGGVGMTDSSDFSESLGAEEGDQEPVSPRDTPLGPVGTPPHLGAVGTPPSFRGRGGMRGRGFATSPGGSSGDILRPPSNPSE